LHLSFRWLDIKELANSCVASHETLKLSEQAWKVLAVQSFSELELRQDDSNWRSCLRQKMLEPKFNLATFEWAIRERGENPWKFRPHWAQCIDCSYIFYIGECGSHAPMERSPCPGCGSTIGGKDHVRTRAHRTLSDRDAEAVFGATRSCVRSVKVNVTRLGGHAFVVRVSKDCTVSEAKAMIYQELCIPTANQKLLIGETMLDSTDLLCPSGAADVVDVDLVVTQIFYPGTRVRKFWCQQKTGVVVAVEGLSRLQVQFDGETQPAEVHASDFEAITD